jgi:hypothetical protein
VLGRPVEQINGESPQASCYVRKRKLYKPDGLVSTPWADAGQLQACPLARWAIFRPRPVCWISKTDDLMLRPDTPVDAHLVDIGFRQAAVYISLDRAYEPVTVPAACVYYQAYMWNTKYVARWENKERDVSRPRFLSELS